MAVVLQPVESFAQEEAVYLPDRGTGIVITSKATDFASEIALCSHYTLNLWKFFY